LLALPFVVAACDVMNFIQDPLPTVEQTWSIPSPEAEISVAELLPNGVDTTTDGTAFQVTLNGVGFQRRVGDDCAQCQTLNGTNAIKPNFVLATGSSTPMPTGIVSAAMIGGQVTVQINNNLSFDPVRVKVNAPASTDPAQQGRMVIVVRSGSLVVGKDSINGVTTAFPPGSVLNRPITLTTGNISSTLAVDLTLTSPPSDNSVFINANGTLNASVAVPDFRVAQVRMNVVNQPITSPAGTEISLGGLDEMITDAIQSAQLEMTITNPFTIAGNLDVDFDYGTGTITKQVALPNGVAQIRTVSLTAADMTNLVSAQDKIDLSVNGNVNSTAPIDVTPQQRVTISNRLILKILAGGSTICPKNFCLPSGDK
jgi:hypothetical protein